MENSRPPRLHLLLRSIFFMAAGGVAGIVLAGISIHQWSIEWPFVSLLALLGTTAASLDVFLFEKSPWSIVWVFLSWSAGFLFLTLLMAVVLVIPYALLAGISKAFGVWEAWEHISTPWSILIPFCFGTMVAYGGWRLLDDY